MANIIKNQIYPYIKQYINEYLHGFSQEKIDIQLAKGEVTLEKMSLRPDTINKILDESNVPFWIKVGLIKKIGIGASVLSVIGEIPIEIEIDGVDIMLSPSYKWIINYIKNKSDYPQAKDISNPLGNDIFNKKPDDFDLSIFKVDKIQEIFRDKTVLSKVINSIFKGLYTFYNSPNFVAVIKIKNVHIRFEDDELMNYTGDIALGMKVNMIQMKVGCKGNMKKNSIKLESLDIYWENDAKILISSNFLNGCIIDGKLQEKYYANLKNVRFEKFEYLPSTKFIIQDFNFTMNVGTRNENKGDIDIFDIKTTPSMVYLQLASNELNVNIYPEIAKIQNNFNEFLAQFPIIEKVKDFRPFVKPSDINSMKYINLVENYRKNVIDNNNKQKMLVRDWINYFYWFQKSKRGERIRSANPIRTEFVRFYNICIKKEDIHKLMKDKEKDQEKEKEKKEDKKNEKEEIKAKIEKEKKIQKAKEVKKENVVLIAGGTPMGDENENMGGTPGGTPYGETPTPGETPEEEKKEEEVIIPSEFDFSSRIDLLIKGININLHSPLNGKNHDYISLSINGVEIKIKLTKEKFDFSFKIKTIDLGPSNLHIGQRVIIQPKSYRKAIPEQNMTSINANVPYGNLSAYNYVSLPNSNLGSRITGLIKKYNPKHEEKIKKIDEALELAESNSRVVSLAASEMGDYTKFKGTNKIRSKTPFGDTNSVHNLAQSAINVNVADLGKTYGSVFVPRNVSFAKNLIDNYEANSLQSKIYKRKKNNEINISQAINDYNSYKNQEKRKFGGSKSPPSLLSSSHFNLRESQFGIKPSGTGGRNVPLNLLEIFSNTEVGAFSLVFSKYNNPVTIDNLAIEIGTIRLNMFANYLLDILRILSEYKKATNTPKIATSGGNFHPSGQSILELQEYFYNYLLKKIPDYEKTESMNEYMEYLKREIISKKKFSSKPEHFALNQVFSFFPKGFDFHFDYENIEIVAYDKDNIVSSKIIIPSSEVMLSLTFTKIFIKLLELEIEITDLNKCEAIIEQLKDLAKDKFKVVEIVIEPCYKQIKDDIEPLLNLKDTSVEYHQILKNQIQENNNNYAQNLNIENIEQDENEEGNLEINTSLGKQIIPQKNEENSRIQNQLLLQKQKEQQELLRRQQEQQILLQKQKEQQELLRRQQEQQILIQKQKEQQELLRRQQEQQILFQKQKEQQELLRRQQEQQQKLLLMKKQEEEAQVQNQNQENKIQLQKQKENFVQQQQLERQQKLLLLKQQQQKRKEKENALLNQNQIQNNLRSKIPKSQNNLQQQQKITNIQSQHPQNNISKLQQQQIQAKKQLIKSSRKAAPVANSPKPKSQNKNIIEDEEKIPRDTIKNNKRINNSNYNTNINIKNKYNLPQVQKQFSEGAQQGSTILKQLGLNSPIQQYVTYDNPMDRIVQNQNLSNTNYNVNIIPNYNNTGNIYQTNIPQSSYIVEDNNLIIGNNNDGFNLFNSGEYA